MYLVPLSFNKNINIYYNTFLKSNKKDIASNSIFIKIKRKFYLQCIIFLIKNNIHSKLNTLETIFYTTYTEASIIQIKLHLTKVHGIIITQVSDVFSIH